MFRFYVSIKGFDLNLFIVRFKSILLFDLRLISVFRFFISLLLKISIIEDLNYKSVGREGFEPSKPKQRIYSPSHLATLESPQRASYRDRTNDLLITSQLLYQLS